MRNLLPFLLVLLLAACNQTPKLEPVAVDEAAAYPKQEPGTRPPVLTGFEELTQEKLAEGWIQLFDGISTYGWEVNDDQIELTLVNGKNVNQNKNYLLVTKSDNKDIVLSHCFFQYEFSRIRENNDFMFGVGVNPLQLDLDFSFSSGNSFQDFFLYACCIRPKHIQNITEADWKPVSGQSKAAWNDGELELSGGLGMIETVQEYGDFVLQLEYYTEAGVNSGVFFRCIPGETLNGYECQVFNNPPAEDYDKFIGTDTGGIFRRCVGRNVGPKDGQWNFLTIAARGPNIATWVNGIQTVDWTDTRKEDDNPRKGLRLKPGTIQLQGHDPSTKIKFRNIRISNLGN